jgi:hypothetical protein
MNLALRIVQYFKLLLQSLFMMPKEATRYYITKTSNSRIISSRIINNEMRIQNDLVRVAIYANSDIYDRIKSKDIN